MKLAFWYLILILLPLTITCSAQQNQTAQDVVPSFDGSFGYGSNMGYFPPHYYDKELAALLHGLPEGETPGVGVTTIRPGLFEHFLDYWGYDIRLDAFKYYQKIGLRDLTVIIGYPSEAHRDHTQYCPGSESEVFAGLYEPIWDNGENGTPVNDANLYALYVWKMVSLYGPYVKYWEVWNEPDVDNGNAWAPPGTPGNWWENAPQPCETKIKAPIFYYNRLLRISYEVIKSIDPNDYVCVGGLGWPSYLDVICRYTDDPNNGAVSPAYPLTGGAYFDVMSFHSYPHIDNSLREWSNEINGFKYYRHSDKAVDGVWALKKKFNTVLKNRGYNGNKYPLKRWILTETNIPRKEFGDYIGSDEAQRNFMMKALVTAQREGLDQLYIYSVADEKPEAEATNEFAYMGLFKNLDGAQPYAAQKNEVATAYKTTSDLLRGKTYDAERTAELQLPGAVRGGAFKDAEGQYTYVLWARTRKDRDETTAFTYAFPEALGFEFFDKKFWHYSESGAHILCSAAAVELTGSPVFLTAATANPGKLLQEARISPNPLPGGYAVFSFWMPEEGDASVEVFDSAGRQLQVLAEKDHYAAGLQQIVLDWSAFAPGAYHLRLTTASGSRVISAVKQ